jgi:hypothetical protein
MKKALKTQTQAMQPTVGHGKKYKFGEGKPLQHLQDVTLTPSKDL